DVTFTKTKLDRDAGHDEYEIEFTVGGVEYEYTIDAATGKITDFDIED
ncbi:MAG: PepSY domain-containing protein, partial [Oscillospiraceae bacterium]|nr:PepSY domain-containing protein [Oscillospiraceae bacterium]